MEYPGKEIRKKSEFIVTTETETRFQRGWNNQGIGTPVRVPKTAELIATQIRRMIIRGELSEGDALQPEAQLMREFAVSRPTIREAFRILESENLISVSRGSRGGAKVHRPKKELVTRYAGFVLQAEGATIADVFETRLAMEPLAARLAARNNAHAASAALRADIEKQRRLIEEPTRNLDADIEAMVDFHRTLAETCKNVTLELLLAVLEGIIARHLQVLMSSNFDRPAHELAETWRAVLSSQEKLANLIEAGKAEEAKTHWRQHLEMLTSLQVPSGNTNAVIDLLD